MDALTLLKKQHAEVKGLFDEFEQTNDGRMRRGLFVKIADRLAAHATIEEKIFYPGVYVGDLKSQLKEAVEEHLAMKRTIADLLQLSVSAGQYVAKMKVLRDEVEHHIEEEEGELFPKVTKLVSQDKLKEMGKKMANFFDELLEGDPRKDVPNQTSEAAHLR